MTETKTTIKIIEPKLEDYANVFNNEDKQQVTFKLNIAFIQRIYQGADEADVTASCFISYLLFTNLQRIAELDGIKQQLEDYKQTSIKEAHLRRDEAFNYRQTIADLEEQITSLTSKLVECSSPCHSPKNEPLEQQSKLILPISQVEEQPKQQGEELNSYILSDHFKEVEKSLSYSLRSFINTNFGFSKDIKVLTTSQVKKLLIITDAELNKLRAENLLTPIKSSIVELKTYNFYNLMPVLKILTNRKEQIKSILLQKVLSSAKQEAQYFVEQTSSTY
jgi:hypothetical protein